MKVLLLDIETSPNTAYVWGLWDQNVGLNQIIESSETLCWTAKWLDSHDVYFNSLHTTSRHDLVRSIHSLLDTADIVVHYNGTKFDIPTLNKEFLMEGLDPPSPYKQVDLYQVVKRSFRFPSNKLDYVVQALGIGKKQPTSFTLWVDCMNNNADAWKVMEEYNRHDVVLLESLYERLKPWIRQPINYSVVSHSLVCPNCGSSDYVRRGFALTATCKYQRYKCKSCSNWFRSTKNEGPKAGQKYATL